MTKDSAVKFDARAAARAYTIRAREEASSQDVIIGTFSLYDTNVIALIDPGSTHLYVCKNLVSSKKLPVESTEFVIKVSNPSGKYVLVDKICKNCPLKTQGYSFPADLMLLRFDVFNVILGWFAYSDFVDVGSEICEKSCEAYLTYVLDTKVSEKKIELVPVVCECSDVFLEELSGLPPVKEIEFAIELIPGTSPISIALYKMAPIELKA
ncbi:Transposon Ty3-G Gag-Pol polyprotein [Gossypium australe]|uniref:Transposon Ty3-G Gag-Pol polyprotein n=1 Tax=Gossypium australe TaxID=47621 RepID=A0A5B6VWM9_9ROSI|nr:Transposon Ty3-G Gag-Pol polyprotein [Gossypium australe]